MRRTPISLLVMAGIAAGCGGSDDAGKAPAVRDGAVVYRDALRNNHGGWLLDEKHFTFADGAYQWRNITGNNSPVVLPDKLLEHPIPKGLAVSVAVQLAKGEALRVVDCRELGPADGQPTDWYELGVDGRQAIIRRMAKGAPPKVLARSGLSIPSGRRVRLTAHCVPDAEGKLVLALKVDGKPVISAVDAKPLPVTRDGVAGLTSLRAYRRPDSPEPASVTWQDFEVRSATLP